MWLASGAPPPSQVLSIQAPDDLVGRSLFGPGVLLELHEQIVEESALSAAVRSLEDIYSVLPDSPAECVDVAYQPVCEEPVGEKGMVRPLHKQAARVIVDKVDGFGIVRIFVYALAHIAVHHVIEHLEDIAKDQPGRLAQKVREFGEGERCALLALLYLPAQVGYGGFFFSRGRGFHYRTSLEIFLSFMV